MKQLLSRSGDVVHQHGRGLQVPIRRLNIGVAEIGAERRGVMADGFSVVFAGFE